MTLPTNAATSQVRESLDRFARFQHEVHAKVEAGKQELLAPPANAHVGQRIDISV